MPFCGTMLDALSGKTEPASFASAHPTRSFHIPRAAHKTRRFCRHSPWLPDFVSYCGEPGQILYKRTFWGKLTELDNNLLRRLYVGGGNEHWQVGAGCYQYLKINLKTNVEK